MTLSHECCYEREPAFLPSPAQVLASCQWLLERELEIPLTEPPVKQVADVKAHVVIKESKLIRGEGNTTVFIKGTVRQMVMYVADCTPHFMHVLWFEVPFCTFLEVKGCYSSQQMLKPEVAIRHIEVEPKWPRIIEECLLLFIWIPHSVATVYHGVGLPAFSSGAFWGKTALKARLG